MEINLFRLCSGLKVISYFMILLVAAIVAVSYYAVGVLTVAPHFKTNPLPSIFVTFIFHFLLVMLLWCYFMVVFTDPGSVPENWKPLMQEDMLETGLAGNSLTSSEITAAEASISTHSTDGQERRPELAYCSRCRNAKPPRCHHCSVCQRCVLKMDHHCIWVVNCVGAANYKSFLLFLLYTFLETTMNTIVLLPTFIDFFSEAKTHATSPGNLAVIFVTFVLNLAFSLSLLCFVVMHISLLSSNTTTVEVHEKRRATRWKYDLGRKRNFEQVFGTKKALWFFPLLSKEDLDNIPALRGLEFPTVSDSEA